MATPSTPSSTHIPLQRNKSCETACSSNSSCFFQRRQPTNPLARSLRSTRSTGNAVRQRVMSAKLLKLRSVQNQLNDANFHLAELTRENQALKTLQKRQDKALSKYEGTNADLPRLLQGHGEEIRVLTEKNRSLRKSLKDLNEQMKLKDEELTKMQAQLKHFRDLDKDKHLLEREKLIEQLEDCKMKLQKSEAEIVVLNRKLLLEEKSNKQKLNTETAKGKQSQRELSQAIEEIDRLTKLLDNKEKLVTNRRRFPNVGQRQSLSMVSLSGVKSTEKLPVTEVKIQNKLTLNGILKSPSDNIKARLSLSDTSSDEKGSSTTLNSRPNSSLKLEKIDKPEPPPPPPPKPNQSSDETDDSEDSLSKRIGNYCKKALDSVNNCNDIIESHKENLESARCDTDKLLESMKEVESLELKLKQSTMMSLENDDSNLDFVSKILTEELNFQKKYKGNGSVEIKEPQVAFSDKKKLLATLRAIDNGDSIESLSNTPERKSKLMEALFGDVGD